MVDASTAASFHMMDVVQLRREVDSLRSSLSAETERGVQKGGEIARLSTRLYEVTAMCSDLLAQRNMFKQQFDDQLKFKRGPLEAQLIEANRALCEQRLQFRRIVDALAVQRDWVREWALQAQENQRLRDVLTRIEAGGEMTELRLREVLTHHREAGTEVTELRRALLEAQAKYAEQTLGLQQRDVASAIQDSKARSLALKIDRLTANNTLLQEQVKRLWKWGASEKKSSTAVEEAPDATAGSVAKRSKTTATGCE